MMHVTAVYPGTFDPMTVGHTDVAERASRMFDEVIIGVAASVRKKPFFSLEERIELANQITAPLDNVSVQSFDGLLMRFVKSVDGHVVIRGLRAISDFDYEVQIAGVNRHLEPSVETVFIAASQDFTFLSSSIVREIARHEGDFSDFVHPVVVDAFRQKYAELGR